MYCGAAHYHTGCSLDTQRDAKRPGNRDIRRSRLGSGKVGKVQRPAGAEIVDAKGDTLLPGPIDAHAHFFEFGGPQPKEVADNPREQAFPVTTRQLLFSGVTTARAHLFDLVHGPALKRDAASDCFPGAETPPWRTGHNGRRTQHVGPPVHRLSQP